MFNFWQVAVAKEPTAKARISVLRIDGQLRSTMVFVYTRGQVSYEEAHKSNLLSFKWHIEVPKQKLQQSFPCPRLKSEFPF